MKRKISLALIVVLLLVFGCGSRQLDTPDKKYLAARMELNKTMKSYLAHRSTLSEEDRKAMAEKVYPYFKNADLALDAWSAALLGEGSIYIAEEEFLMAKKSLITLLVAQGVIKVEK